MNATSQMAGGQQSVSKMRVPAFSTPSPQGARWFRLSTINRQLLTFFSLSPRFVKFCLVGGSGVFVDMGVLFLLADPRMLGLNIALSKICAAEIALINNFIWNELWTFRSSSLCPSNGSSLAGAGEGGSAHAELGEGRVAENIPKESAGGEVASLSGVRRSTLDPRRSLACRFLLFNAICGMGIGLAVFLLHLFRSSLGLNLYLANLLAIVLVTFWNFALNARLNWQIKQ
jgi:dolichol-phosphate mannosyltransferase